MNPNVNSRVAVLLIWACLSLSGCGGQDGASQTPAARGEVDSREPPVGEPAAALPERVARPENPTPDESEPVSEASVDSPWTVVPEAPGEVPESGPLVFGNGDEPTGLTSAASLPECPSGYHWVDDDA